MKKEMFVGIDVSKETLDVAITIDGKQVEAAKKVRNDMSGFTNIYHWIRKHGKRMDCEKIVICLESTGIYSENVSEYFQDKEDINLSEVNPMQIKSFANSRLLRTKTDKVDAKTIAFYAHAVRPEVTIAVPKELKELKALQRHYQYLKDRCAQEKIRLESATNKKVKTSIESAIEFYKQQMEKLDKEIKEHIEKHEDIKKKIELLTSIDGIGKETSRGILCELHAEGLNNKINAKAQAAHAGLAPGKRESGKSVRGKERICKTGNSRLRKILYFPTLSAIQNNAVIKEFYNGLISRGKSKIVAVVACMRKLLTISIGVLNNNSLFDPDWKKITA